MKYKQCVIATMYGIKFALLCVPAQNNKCPKKCNAWILNKDCMEEIID